MIGDNALSSLYIPEGLKVILYENADFTGKQMILMHNTDLYSSTDFNDKTSAIEIIDLYARWGKTSNTFWKITMTTEAAKNWEKDGKLYYDNDFLMEKLDGAPIASS